MHAFATLFHALDASTSSLAKQAALQAYLRAVDPGVKYAEPVRFELPGLAPVKVKLAADATADSGGEAPWTAASFEVERVSSSKVEGGPGHKVEVTVRVLPLGLPEPRKGGEGLEEAPPPMEVGDGDAD